jgi:hypothetical protein
LQLIDVRAELVSLGLGLAQRAAVANRLTAQVAALVVALVVAGLAGD